MADARTPCQKIDALLSFYRRPLHLRELAAYTKEDVDTVVVTVNRMIGAGLLGALSGGFVYRPRPSGERRPAP